MLTDRTGASDMKGPTSANAKYSAVATAVGLMSVRVLSDRIPVRSCLKKTEASRKVHVTITKKTIAELGPATVMVAITPQKMELKYSTNAQRSFSYDMPVFVAGPIAVLTQ